MKGIVVGECWCGWCMVGGFVKFVEVVVVLRLDLGFVCYCYV